MLPVQEGAVCKLGVWCLKPCQYPCPTPASSTLLSCAMVTWSLRSHTKMPVLQVCIAVFCQGSVAGLCRDTRVSCVSYQAQGNSLAKAAELIYTT